MTEAKSAKSQKSQKTVENRRRAIGYHTEAPDMIEVDHVDFIKPGVMLNDRFTVMQKVKSGGFGQIFVGGDSETKTRVAIKVEDKSSSGAVMEISVIRRFVGNQHCPKLFGFGIYNDQYTYIVMQLLGENLAEAKRRCPLRPPRMSVVCSCRVTMQCLNAVQNLHDLGFLHRDIKPSNFAIGLPPNYDHIVYLIDYGLCRGFLDRNGNVRPERKKLGFRGTIRYASLNAHNEKDLARRDDLVSVFYSWYELIAGDLPWKDLDDQQQVMQMKMKYTLEKMSEPMPDGAGPFVGHIVKLEYADKPQYDFLAKCLAVIIAKRGSPIHGPFDWRIEDCRKLEHMNPTPIQIQGSLQARKSLQTRGQTPGQGQGLPQKA